MPKHKSYKACDPDSVPPHASNESSFFGGLNIVFVVATM